jgi:hypothetical protein
MAAPVTLLQSPNGDLDMTRGLRLTESSAQFVAQRVRSRLLFFLGEWFINVRLGVPYFLKVFVSNPDLSLVKAIFRRVIVGTPGVKSLDTFDVKFLKRERTLNVKARILSTDGETVPINVPLIVPGGA